MTPENKKRLEEIRAKGDSKDFYDCNFLLQLISELLEEVKRLEQENKIIEKGMQFRDVTLHRTTAQKDDLVGIMDYSINFCEEHQCYELVNESLVQTENSFESLAEAIKVMCSK